MGFSVGQIIRVAIVCHCFATRRCVIVALLHYRLESFLHRKRRRGRVSILMINEYRRGRQNGCIRRSAYATSGCGGRGCGESAILAKTVVATRIADFVRGGPNVAISARRATAATKKTLSTHCRLGRGRHFDDR